MSRLLLVTLVATFCHAAASATAIDAEEIMRRVAGNQERAREVRKSYVYDMSVFVRLKRRNGKVAREETRDFVVAPGEKGAKRRLRGVNGKIFESGRVQAYDKAGFRTKDSDIDGAITDSFARDVMWRKGGFGPALSWFPIDAQGVHGYTFRLMGEERYRGYDVYRVAYAANSKDDCWKGEVLVERNEMQPVLATTEWSCRIPASVKVMLGTNVEHMGAKMVYERFEKDLWFPVKCGGEMKIRVLFLYSRTIGFNATNDGFRKTDVRSSIEFDSKDWENESEPESVEPR